MNLVSFSFFCFYFFLILFYFIFVFILLFFILDLNKRCGVISHVIVTQVTKCNVGMTTITVTHSCDIENNIEDFKTDDLYSITTIC